MFNKEGNWFTAIGNFFLNLIYYRGRLGQVTWFPESDNLADDDAFLVVRTNEGKIIEIPFAVENRYLALRLKHHHYMAVASLAILKLNSHDYEVRPFAYRTYEQNSTIHTLYGRVELQAAMLWPVYDEQEQYTREQQMLAQRRKMDARHSEFAQPKARLASVDMANGLIAKKAASKYREPRDVFGKWELPKAVRTATIAESELFDPRELIAIQRESAVESRSALRWLSFKEPAHEQMIR